VTEKVITIDVTIVPNVSRYHGTQLPTQIAHHCAHAPLCLHLSKDAACLQL